MTPLEVLHQEIAGCRLCVLRQRCRQPVPGTGPPSARIMMVGEGPGEEEDKRVAPFVGPSGRLLRQLSQEAGLDIEHEVFLTNIVKCRPPNNRDPAPEEVRTCLPYLDRQIALINPKVIVAIGRHAMMQFLPDEGILKVHGRPRWVNGRIILPIIHPAGAMRNPEWKPSIRQDLRLIPRLLATRPSHIDGTFSILSKELNP